MSSILGEMSMNTAWTANVWGQGNALSTKTLPGNGENCDICRDDAVRADYLYPVFFITLIMFN
jgi:hypothetical protein